MLRFLGRLFQDTGLFNTIFLKKIHSDQPRVLTGNFKYIDVLQEMKHG